MSVAIRRTVGYDEVTICAVHQMADIPNANGLKHIRLVATINVFDRKF
jgi:hypothetical protein